MRRFCFATSIMWVIILAFVNAAWSAAPTGGVITTNVRTNTDVLVQVTTAPTAVDSVFVCYIKIGGADTVFTAQIDSVTKAKVVTSQPPGLNAAYFLLVRQGAGGKTAISNKDTMIVYGPEIEAAPNTNAMRLNEKMVRAVSWRPLSILTTFTVNGSTGSDSTGHYNLWKNNAFVFSATQAGDSVKAMAYFAFGYREMSQAGATFGFSAYSDSVNITGPGIFRKTITTSTAFGVMYIKFAGYVGNGKNAAIEVYAIRDRY